jgi:hypothetical protein
MRHRTLQRRRYGGFILSDGTSRCSAPPILMVALLGISIIGLCVYLSSVSASTRPQIQMRISTRDSKVAPNNPIPISVVVENFSDVPIIYYRWACPEYGNFQTQSKCFTVDPGNMDCLSNFATRTELKKGQSLRRDLLVHVDKQCAGHMAPLKIGFFADGSFASPFGLPKGGFFADGGFGEKTPVLAESNEIRFEITQ